MKKLMKLLIATALVLTMAVCFAACGGKTMNTAVVYEEKPVAVATQTGRLANFDDQSTVDSNGEWVVFGQQNLNDKKEYVSTTYTLYNAATEKVVATSTTKNGNPFQLITYFEGSENEVNVAAKISGYVESGSTGSYTKISAVYYDETTVDVGSVKISDICYYDYSAGRIVYTNYNWSAGLVEVGDFIFKVVDGKISHIENETASIDAVDAYANGYYYDVYNDSGECTGITVYDASLNLYGFVRVPSYAYDVEPFALSNGNVLIQYAYATDWTGDDYEIIEYGQEKSNLVSVLYNVEKNTAKEIKFDYVIDSVVTEGLAEKVDNLACVYAIEDNRINANTEAAIYCELSNNGKVGTIYGKAEDYLVNAGLYAIAADRYIALSISGELILYNGEMEKIATFSEKAGSSMYSLLFAGGQYIVDGDKYYSKDGNLIIDTAEYESYKTFDNGNKIFYKVDEDNDQQKEYFLLANGSFNKIATVKNNVAVDDTTSEAISGFGSNYYVITNGTKNTETNKWTYTDKVYNMNGQEITSTTTAYVKSDYGFDYATEDKGTYIRRSYVTEAEGLLVFKVTVKKFNANKDENDKVIGYETTTEYYYCK